MCVCVCCGGRLKGVFSDHCMEVWCGSIPVCISVRGGVNITVWRCGLFKIYCAVNDFQSTNQNDGTRALCTSHA